MLVVVNLWKRLTTINFCVVVIKAVPKFNVHLTFLIVIYSGTSTIISKCFCWYFCEKNVVYFVFVFFLRIPTSVSWYNLLNAFRQFGKRSIKYHLSLRSQHTTSMHGISHIYYFETSKPAKICIYADIFMWKKGYHNDVLLHNPWYNECSNYYYYYSDLFL